MIRLRVEWHHTCPGCGVKLVIDFLDDSRDCRVCPWCGYAASADPRAAADDLRDYLASATKEIEETANRRAALSR